MPSDQNSFKKFCFLIYDGISFFGFASYKLNRLKGQEPKWYDCFLDRQWLSVKLVTLYIIVHVVVQQLLLVGDVKS